MFFRLVSDKVLYYRTFNTFFVLCLITGTLIAFEAVFGFLRSFLVLHLTTRIDVKLSTYTFEKVLNLPIEFFERTQVGLIARDMREVWRVRQFLTGQLFGRC